MKAFSIGVMGKRALSKRELEEQRKKEEEKAAAHVCVTRVSDISCDGFCLGFPGVC